MDDFLQLCQELELSDFKQLFNCLVSTLYAVKDIVICEDVSASHVRYVEEALKETVRLGSEVAISCLALAKYALKNKDAVLSAIDNLNGKEFKAFLTEVFDKLRQCQERFGSLFEFIAGTNVTQKKNEVKEKADQASTVAKLGKGIIVGGGIMAGGGFVAAGTGAAVRVLGKPESLVVLDSALAKLAGAAVTTPYTGALVLIGGGLVLALAGLIAAYLGHRIAKRSEKLERAYKKAHEKISDLLSHWDLYQVKMRSISTHIDNDVSTTLTKWTNEMKVQQFLTGSQMIKSSLISDMGVFFDSMRRNMKVYKHLSEATKLEEFAVINF